MIKSGRNEKNEKYRQRRKASGHRRRKGSSDRIFARSGFACGRQGVLCVDNFFTAPKGNSSKADRNPSFELMRHDVTFPLGRRGDENFTILRALHDVHYQFAPCRRRKRRFAWRDQTCWDSQRAKRRSCRHPRARSTAIRGCHPQTPEATGATFKPYRDPLCYYGGAVRTTKTSVFSTTRPAQAAIKVRAQFQHLRAGCIPTTGCRPNSSLRR